VTTRFDAPPMDGWMKSVPDDTHRRLTRREHARRENTTRERVERHRRVVANAFDGDETGKTDEKVPEEASRCGIAPPAEFQAKAST